MYAHIEIVVAFFVVKIPSCLIIASYGAGVMTWEFGEMFSHFSFTFLYLLEAKIQAIDPSCLPPPPPPRKFNEKTWKNNYYLHLSVKEVISTAVAVTMISL